jgi:adenylate cyclase
MRFDGDGRSASRRRRPLLGRRRRSRPVQARAAVRGVIFLQVAANGAGALVVLIYLRLLFPLSIEDRQSDELGLDVVVFGLYLVVTVLLAIPINRMVLRRGVQWVRQGRDPTPQERRATLQQPFRQTVSAFLVWLGAAIIFGLLNETEGRVPVGIVIAGLVTCSLLYLLLERHFRPIFELALEGAELPENRREILPRLMLAWLLGSAVPLIGLGLAPVAAADSQIALGWRMTLLVVTGIVAGGLVMRAAAGSVAGPINRVRRALGRVEAGDLEVRLPVDDLGEIGRLSAGFNAMVEGLREREQLHDLLDKQVGAEVTLQALSQDQYLGGERRVVTVLFVDLTGYTTFAEARPPEQVVAALNRFFQVVVDVVRDEGGLVNQFEGDAAMCLFGAPMDQPDHAARALRAAARLPLELARLTETPHAGIGVATGEAVAGFVGTTERFEYTVIGDVVNLAARLCDLAKGYDSGVLASAETVELAGTGTTAWRAAGPLEIRGRRQEADVFEVVAAS